ncbi:hypothetical protein RFI_38694, partial [Reticulomyxa filosa]
DIYSFSCFIFLTLVTVWSCIVGGSNELDDDSSNWKALVGFSTAFVLFHCSCLVIAYWKRQEELLKLEKTTEQLEDDIAKYVCIWCLRSQQKTLISSSWSRSKFARDATGQQQNKPDLVMRSEMKNPNWQVVHSRNKSNTATNAANGTNFDNNDNDPNRDNNDNDPNRDDNDNDPNRDDNNNNTKVLEVAI